jgi:iron complex outermembrane receptor protein
MIRFLILLYLLLLSFSIHAQLKGKVYDRETNEPLTDVTIAKNDEIITTTNIQGYFEMSNISNNDTLIFEHIGYHSEYVLAKKDTFISVYLKSKSIAIGDVTINAYGTNQQAFQSPAALEVLNANLVNDISLASPANVMNSMPGLYMHSGAKNTNRITIRGIGSRSMYTTTKIKAYLNEIPLTSGIGETTLEDLDMDILDRVTVLKGPSPSTYGAALGGTILYNMGVPDEQGLTLKQESTVGSNQLYKNSSAVSWKRENTGIKLIYNRFSDKGFRENDNYNRNALTSLVKHQLNEDINITYVGRFHWLKAYIPSSINEETFNSNPEKAARNWKEVRGHENYYKALNGLTVDISLSNNISAKSSIFLKNYNGDEVRPFNILDDESFSAGTRNIFQWEPEINSIKLSLSAGFEYLNETYNWEIYETLDDGVRGMRTNKNAQDRTRQNYFSSLSASWNNFHLSAGVNMNQSKYKYKDILPDTTDFSDQKQFKPIASPRISLTYKLNEQALLFGNLSHGFSTPSYEETLNAQGYVTGSISPETGWNREAGIRLRSADRNLFFKLTGYSIAVENLLVTKRIAEDEFFKMNAGKTRHDGLEVLSRLRIIDNHIIKSSINASYMFTRYKFKDFTDEGVDYSGNYLPGIPQHKAFLQLKNELSNGIYLIGNMIWTDRMPMNDANNKYSDAYYKINLKGGFRKTLSNKWLIQIYGGIRNIMNTHYASMILINAPSFGGAKPRYYYPGEPRNYFGGIAVNYYLGRN